MNALERSSPEVITSVGIRERDPPSLSCGKLASTGLKLPSPRGESEIVDRDHVEAVCRPVGLRSALRFSKLNPSLALLPHSSTGR